MCALSLGGVASTAQQAAGQQPAAGHVIGVTLEGRDAPYELFVPERVAPGRRTPLILALPGESESARDHALSLARVSRRGAPVTIVVPRLRAPAQPGVVGALHAPEVFEEIVAEVSRRQPIDTGMLFLEGRSVGGDAAVRMVERGTRWPFRAVFVHGGSVAPSVSARRIPYVFIVGERAIDVGGSNVVERVRRAYRRAVDAGHDAEYVEIPDVLLDLGDAGRALIAERIASTVSYSDMLPAAADFPDELQPTIDLVRAGRFGPAFHGLDVLIEHHEQEKALAESARSIAQTIERGLAEKADDAGRYARDYAAYREWRKIHDSLEPRPALRKLLADQLERIGKRRRVRLELAAEERFFAALQRAARGEEPASAFGSWPFRSFSGTVYGKRARAHLRALSGEYWSDD